MMFRVRWSIVARDELAALWLQSDSQTRSLITAAASQIDHRLRSNPRGHSESRTGSRRILFELPLGITFRIEPDGRTISVLHTWLILRRTSAGPWMNNRTLRRSRQSSEFPELSE
jgi:plasmid stabilization system protein ParE